LLFLAAPEMGCLATTIATIRCTPSYATAFDLPR
jgi:hypothetical protein